MRIDTISPLDVRAVARDKLRGPPIHVLDPPHARIALGMGEAVEAGLPSSDVLAILAWVIKLDFAAF